MLSMRPSISLHSVFSPLTPNLKRCFTSYCLAYIFCKPDLIGSFLLAQVRARLGR